MPQILIGPIILYKLSLREIWSYLDQQKQNYGAKKLENFLLCYMRKWVVAILLPTNMTAAIEMYQDLSNCEQPQLLQLLVYNLTLAENLRNNLLTLCENFVKNVINLNF